jgi:hypothetical protein
MDFVKELGSGNEKEIGNCAGNQKNSPSLPPTTAAAVALSDAVAVGCVAKSLYQASRAMKFCCWW